MKKLYVGNLPYKATEDDLVRIFSQAGNVVSAVVIRDKQDNRSKGFGFVEMDSDDSAQTALSTLNGTDLDGRQIRISEAREREDSSRGGGGGHSRRSGGGGGDRDDY